MNRTRNFLTAALLAAGLVMSSAAPLPAQNPQETERAERKNRAPVSKEILRVKLPKPYEAKLENGLTVLIMEDHRFPSVSMQLQISGSGAVYEPDGKTGLASITASMLREGTKTRSSQQIASTVDGMGATLGANAGFGSAASALFASGLSDNLDDWFGVAVDVLLNPSFPADELNRLKQRLKVQLRNQRAQPGLLAIERFNQAVYGKHPAAVVTYTEASIDAVTSEDLAEWHRTRYVPQNAILAIAGDVYPNQIMPKLRRWLAGWKKTDLVETPPPSPAPAKAKKIFLVDRPDSVQTTLQMGNIAIDRRSPDYAVMTVLHRVLGSSSTARLFNNLREDKGYTYGAYSGFSASKWSGPWNANSDVRTEVTDGAMKEFLYELNRIRDEKVPDQELEEAKRSIVGSFARNLESATQLLTYAMTTKIYGFPADYWDKYPAQISAVTADDVQRVARKYINPETMQIVAVGDASKIKSVLEKYGQVELYDTEGKPVTSSSSGSNR